MACRGHIGHAADASRQLLCDEAPHVVIVEIEHDDGLCQGGRCGQIIRRVNGRAAQFTDGQLKRRIQRSCPARTRRDDHARVFQFQNIVHRELITSIESHVRETPKLAETPVKHSAPRVEPRQACFKAQAAAK